VDRDNFMPNINIMDDYQYKTLNLPIKNKGFFGLGGSQSKNGIGYSGKIIDSSNALLNQFGGSVGKDGEVGATGATGASANLPSSSVIGDMLYYDGSRWKKLDAPLQTGRGLLVIKNYIPQWLYTTKSAILFYDSISKSWKPIFDPSTAPGVRVLYYKNGILGWMQAKDCSYA
jgi:hypothetical protein